MLSTFLKIILKMFYYAGDLRPSALVQYQKLFLLITKHTLH